MRVLSQREVEEKSRLKGGTIAREEAAGRFPRRIQLAPRAIGWLENEVDEWIAARVAERDGKAA
jgi:prophage regulatory protein